jgi:hypothetical protein
VTHFFQMLVSCHWWWSIMDWLLWCVTKCKAVPVYSMKACGGSTFIAPLALMLHAWWRWMVNFTSCTLYSCQKDSAEWAAEPEQFGEVIELLPLLCV